MKYYQEQMLEEASKEMCAIECAVRDILYYAYKRLSKEYVTLTDFDIQCLAETLKDSEAYTRAESEKRSTLSDEGMDPDTLTEGYDAVEMVRLLIKPNEVREPSEIFKDSYNFDLRKLRKTFTNPNTTNGQTQQAGGK